MVHALAFVVTLAATMPVNDYDSCRAWLAGQPGSHLLLNRIVDTTVRFRQSKAGDSLTRRSLGGGWAGHTGWCQISYDAANRRAMVWVTDATTENLIVTRVRDDPVPAKSSAFTASTRLGVTLGMTRDQVVAIEGEGTLLQLSDGEALVYDQPYGTRLAFWFAGHVLAGIMFQSLLVPDSH